MKSTRSKCPHGPEETIFRRVQGGPARRKLALEDFSDLLSEEQLRDLGPVSDSWFEDLTAEALSEDDNTTTGVQDDLQTPLKSHHHGNSQTDIAATPVLDGKDPFTPSTCSPSLFSPNVPECNGTDQKNRFRSEVNMGHSTPVLPQSGKKFIGFSGLSQLRAGEHRRHTLGHFQPSVGLSPGVGGSPLPILPETDSSVLSRRLFKTPQGPSSQGFSSQPITSRFLPTPERLTMTLGGDLDSSALSWTSSMATPGTAAMTTPTAAMTTTEAAEDICDPEEDVSIAADGKKLGRALFMQCEEETDEDSVQKPTQDKPQPEENLRDVFPTFQSPTGMTLTQEFESTLTETSAGHHIPTASAPHETAEKRKHNNGGSHDTQGTTFQTKVAKKVPSMSQKSSSQNSVQNDVDKTLDFLFARSERRSQKKEPPPPKKRKWNEPTSETVSKAVPSVGETGLDIDDSKDNDCKSGTDTSQHKGDVDHTTKMQTEDSSDHVAKTAGTQGSTIPPNSVENMIGKQTTASPVSSLNVDFFSQISPSSLLEICEAADAAAAKSVDSRYQSSGNRHEKEHQVQSSTSNYQLEKEGVADTKDLGLGQEERRDTTSTGKDGKSIECAPSSTVKDCKNSDLQSDEVSFSESPPDINPTQGTLDVMNVSSQVFKQQTDANEGHLAFQIGTARDEEDKTALGSSKKKQLATPSLVFNLKVPANKDSLQDTPKFSATTVNRGASARRFFYPTSSQISNSTPKTLFPSNLHGNQKELKGAVKGPATPSTASSPSLGQGKKQNPLKTRLSDVAEGTSSRTFKLSESSASFGQQNTREYTKKESKLNTEQPSNESMCAKNALDKPGVLFTLHNQSTSDYKTPNRKLPLSAGITDRMDTSIPKQTKETTGSKDFVKSSLSSYEGFQTASRKKIAISDSAMKKAAALAAEVDAEMAKTGPNMSSTSTQFDTGLNKDTDATKQKETRTATEMYTSSETPTKGKCLESSREFGGFCTASNKRIEISEKAMKQAKALVSEVEDSLLAEMVVEQTGSVSDTTSKDRRLPMTTSRRVNVHTKGLETIVQEASKRQLQKEFDPKCMSNTGLVTTSSTKKLSSSLDIQNSCSTKAGGLSIGVVNAETKHTRSLSEFTGFQTASKKPIQVSSDAMKRAESLVKEVESSMAGEAQWEKDRDDSPFSNSNGLQTSLTKESLSSDSISDSKAMTAKLEDFVNTETRKKQYTGCASLHTTGFRTASRKPIQISSGAMRKARSLAAEVDAGLASEKKGYQGLDQTLKLDVTGFTTASKKPIRVAPSSMEKAKALTAEVEDSLPTGTSNNCIDNQNPAPECPGFRTASNKNISVSAQSMQKARLLMAEVDEADQLSSTEEGTARKCSETTATVMPAVENGTFPQPKGRRPFKPPSNVLGPGKCSELPDSRGRSKSVRNTASTNSEVHPISTAAGTTHKPSQPIMEEDNNMNDSFHDDQLFCTQMVSAAEVAESTYAFLQAEKEDGGSDDFGLSDPLQNKGKTIDPSTSLFNGAEKVRFDNNKIKERRSQSNPSKVRQHEIVCAPETKSSRTRTSNAASPKHVEVAAGQNQCNPQRSDQNAVAQGNYMANPTEEQNTSCKNTQEHTAANKKLHTMQKKIVTICDTVKDTDAAMLDESFDLAWGLVDEMLVKAMEASAHKSEEHNTTPKPGQDRQADTSFDHRHSLDSGLGECRITSQDKNVSMTYCSSLEEPRHNNTLTSQEVKQNTEDVSVKEHIQCGDKSYQPPQCPFTTASGRKASVSEEALKHVKEMGKDDLLPPDEISIPIKELSRQHSPREVSHMSFNEHLRETLPAHNQWRRDEEMDLSNNVGFSTARGKKITVSKKSLEKAGQLWNSTEQALQKGKSSTSGETDCSPTFQGFQTTSGHKVSVSDAALAKAKQMWNDAGELKQGMHAVSADRYVQEPEGFKTASGRTVRVSENALQKAQQMWKETEGQQGTSKVNSCSSEFPGFQTASGHKVAVSDAALVKAKQLWNDAEDLEQDMLAVSADKCLPKPEGFKTASGKRVRVSEKALQNAQKMWKETEGQQGTHTTSKVNTCSSEFPGFQTASGHKVAVSEQALLKAQQMWDNTDKGETGLDVNKESCKTFPGLQTASGCTMDVSKESLLTVKQMWNNDNENYNPQRDTSMTSAKLGGFTTAAGKCVQVSEQALQKAKQLWEETETKISPSHKEKSSGFQGFQTASGKKVDISDQALSRAKELWRDTVGESGNEAKGTDSTKESSSKCTGFQTAGGRKVQVSAEALHKAKLLWKDDEVEETFKGNSMETLDSATFNEETFKKQDSMQSLSNVPFAGFKTASGHTVNVSEASLLRAKQMFQDVEETNKSSPNKEPMENSALPKFQGFTTGRGQKIEVSKKSLQFAKEMWKEAEPIVNHPAESAMKRQECSEKSTTKYGGFQTAGGQRIDVSEEALQKAKALFSDDTSLTENDSCKKSSHTNQEQLNNDAKFKGFQTARGQKIEVSEDALKKARVLLSDDVTEGIQGPKMERAQDANTSIFRGFQTAGGQKIEVSKDALQKARALLSDDVTEEISGQEELQVPKKMKSAKDTNTSMFGGFQTAGGQQIEVSEEALQEARARLSEVQDDSMGLDTGFAEKTAEHSPLQKRSVPGVSPSGKDEHGHGVKPGAPQNKGEWLYRDRSSRKRTLTSSDTTAIWPPSKRQSPSPAGYQAQHVGHRQAFRPPVATHPEGVVHDRHGFSVRTRLQPLHSKPRQDFRRPPGLPQAARQPVVSTPQAQNSTENSFRTPFKSPASTFSAPFKAKPDGEEGPAEELYNSAACTTTDNTPDSPEPNQGTCVDDSSICDKDMIITEHPGKAQALRKAREAQALKIAQKKKQTIHPEYGSLLQKRLTQARVGLREAVCSQTPGTYTTEELYSYGVHQSTCTVTSETAESFRFVCRDHLSPAALDGGEGITLTDGGVLVPREDGTAGKEEFVSALLDTPGVDSSLVTPEWIHNHYRWIVWKLAAMETAFPVQFGGRCLTPDQVLMQLKYRYDREVDLSQRSALKKILERDDTPSKTLVLCVARIVPHTSGQDCTSGQDSKKVPQKETIVELTDGWYGVRAALDPPLARLVESKHIYVGQKLCLSGAELVGSQDACSPLEAPANLLLKLSANATRRARWDAKLGYHSNPQPLPVSLGSLCADGGMVGCVDVLVLRSYPMQYMEKYPSGSSVFRSRRAEEKAARKHEEDRNRRMEKLYSQIQDRFERRTAGKGSSVGRRRKSLHLKTEDIENLQTGQEIYNALQGAMDPTEIEQCLSPAQRSRLYDHQRSLQAEQQGELQAEFRKALQQLDDEIPVQRNVVAMYRVKLADYKKKEAGNTELTLTVWRPTDHVMDLLKEGKRLKIFHLSTSAARNQVQLASTRTTRYQDLPVKPDTLAEVYSPRKLATFDELCASDFSPVCGEVDIVGVVVYITGLSTAGNRIASPNNSGVQTVYLADADKNLCCVKFWGGVSSHSLEDVLRLKALVGGANLQLRPDGRHKVPCLVFGDQADFSQKPQHTHLREGLRQLEESIKDVKSFTESMVQEVERVVYSRQPFSPGPSNTSRVWASPNPGNRTGPHTPAARMFTPARAHSTPNNSVSTPRPVHCNSPAVNSQQVTPYGGNPSHSSNVQSSGKGKPSAHPRRNLLDRVPSPPPLTTLVSPIPHRVKRAFKRPGLVPLNNGRGSPAFVPPVKRTVPDTEDSTDNVEQEKKESTVDLGSGTVAEISDAEMASICTQNTPDKREGRAADDNSQESAINAQAQLDGEQREDFISDTQLLSASEIGPGTDAQPNAHSPGLKEKVSPKQSKPLQRRSVGYRRRGRGRRGANNQGTRAAAVHSTTDVEMPRSQTTPEDCTTPEPERLAILEKGESAIPSTIDTVVIEDGAEKEAEVAQNSAGSSQDSVDSQNVATRTRSSLRLAKKRKR
ncbi:breast cancer type 2 susceptibility protein homolog [Branchiostoma lanceolatum]|uniref:breast cancer type 2 susceptibility protein homolog n=1 Tax=Branchiostoma lanceolatum TaxID=7740 RepID=UPI003455FAC1